MVDPKSNLFEKGMKSPSLIKKSDYLKQAHVNDKQEWILGQSGLARGIHSKQEMCDVSDQGKQKTDNGCSITTLP